MSKLEKNGWRPPTPSLNKLQISDSMHKSNQEASDPNSKAASQVKSKPNKVKAQASSGLRAFLASNESIISFGMLYFNEYKNIQLFVSDNRSRSAKEFDAEE